MIIIGVDPGLSGAIAVLDGDRCATVDMPVHHLIRGGRKKGEVDAHALARAIAEMRPAHAFVERVGAMPGQGVSGVFAFGKSYGIVLGVLAALGVPWTNAEPRTWKKVLGVPAAKDGARARASQLLPGASDQWQRVKDDGRAEAALIALYGQRSLGGPTP